MSNIYKIKIFYEPFHNILHKEYDARVHHFRDIGRNSVNGYGGYTSVFILNSGRVYTAKCRNDEQFSRRKGILTCIQKALTPQGYCIASANFRNNGVDIGYLWESDIAEKDKNFWLTNKNKFKAQQ